MPDKNLSLENIERVISRIETSLGLNQPESGGQKIDGAQVYELAKELFFSVPISPNQHEWTPEQRDEVFEKQYLGCSKRHFVATMDARLRQAARRRAREQQLKRRGGR